AVTVTAKDAEKRRVTLDCQCTNQHGEVVISGSAEVLAPTEKVKRQRVSLPEVLLHKPGANYEAVIQRASMLGPVRAAVVFPAEPAALHGIIEATHANLIDPIIIGPEAPLRRVAETLDINLSAFRLEPTTDGRAAAARAVALARAGTVEAIVDPGVRYYGLLHELVAHDTGITDHRRMSHIYAMDVPNYPRLLLITDAGMNTDPTLEEKRAIVQNAIDLALALGIELPKVAILAAVETISPKLRSTLDAAALCKMVDRGQIVGGIVDGPLTFENAVSPEAARRAKLTSLVAGQADILVAPDLEAGTMLVQQLDRLANAQSAGIIVGGRVPVALPEPSGNPQSVLAACAMAVLVARNGTERQDDGMMG
ncbi:MAG: enoyl-CoA hydratase, partial [Roseiflexus castenholzii]